MADHPASVGPSVHDIAIAAQEKRLADLNADIEVRAATLARIDEKLTEFRASLETVGNDWRQREQEAEAHYREVTERAEREHVEKARSFTESIAKHQATRQALVDDITELRPQVESARSEIESGRRELQRLNGLIEHRRSELAKATQPHGA